MVDAIGPVEAELAEDELEHLEMVVLLVSYDIDMLVKAVLCKTLLCCSEVLGHVYRSSVATQKKLPVEAVCRKVTPYGAVLLGLEDACFKSLLHESLSEEIGLGFIVCPVEADSEVSVSLVEAFVNPAVHGLPEFHNLSIAVLPLEKHLLGCLEGRSVLLSLLLGHAGSDKLIDFLLVEVVEGYVVVTHKVVTLLAARCRSLAVTEDLPCIHGLADMDTTVVHEVDLHYIMAAYLKELCNRPSEEVVADVSEVERLVRVRGRILDHDGLSCRRELSVILCRSDLRKYIVPIYLREGDVEETLHGIVTCYLSHVCPEPLSYRVSCILRSGL